MQKMVFGGGLAQVLLHEEIRRGHACFSLLLLYVTLDLEDHKALDQVITYILIDSFSCVPTKGCDNNKGVFIIYWFH